MDQGAASSKRPPRQRRLSARRERMAPFMKLIRRACMSMIGATVILLLICAGMLLYLRAQTLPAMAIHETSQIVDMQGNLIDSFHDGENRQSVALQHVSPYVRQATLAIEDRRFYSHLGFDLKGMARAVAVNAKHMAKKQGASTITQQLARNLFLSHERTWERKLREAMYTAQLEMAYSKDEIIEMYLNQIYYGHGAYGIEAAAQLYFGKPASALTLGESAMLAGVPKGPRYYSPYLNMKNAKDRQRTILSAMVEQGMVTAEAADAAYNELLAFIPLGSTQQEGYAPYFRDYIRYIAVDQLGIDEQLLNAGGIRIFTTLDPVAQQAAEAAVEQAFAADSEQQAALIAIDPRNGYIKAMVGGRNYADNQFNRVFATTRQPGSSFKPIVYLAALEQGGMTPVSRFLSAPTSFTYDEGRSVYEPSNYNDRYFNKEIDMRTAIASSDNIYAVSSLMAVGADKVIETARKLGITSPLQPVPSLALGTLPVSPYEMASAFSALAAGGMRTEPLAITRIEDAAGRLLYEAAPAATQAADPAAAYVLTQLLQGVFDQGGTGYRVAGTLKRPVAGKTGTTSSDAWLVGYTPELSTAVWVGYDKGRNITQAEAHKAAPIFAAFLEKALETVPPKLFPMPEGVTSVYIEPESGLLAGPGCAGMRLETFVRGTEPTELCIAQESQQAPEQAQGQQPGQSSGGGLPEPQQAHKRSWWGHLKRWWEG